MKSWLYSVLSGLLAALASLCGKLAMTVDAPLTFCESTLHLLLSSVFSNSVAVHAACFSWMSWLRVAFFTLMIGCNAAMWTVFTKALDLSRTTLETTVINTAANFFCTAIFGQVLFDEYLGFLWWIGTVMIVFGILLITEGNQRIANRKKQS